MTRETRVGLVLGLVFIIAFGIILTEVRQTSEPVRSAEPAAVLEPSYYSVEAPAMEPIRRTAAPRVAPRRQAPHSTGRVRLAVRPSQPPSPTDEAVVAATIRRQQPTTETTRPAPQPSATARHVARQGGPAAPRQAGRVHTVARGENLYRIAEKAYGTGKGHLWRRIYEANRAAVPDPGRLSIGQQLVIPPTEGEVPAAAATTSRIATGPQWYSVRQVGRDERPNELAPSRRGVVRMYTVRRGDNLTSIAREQLRDDSPAAVRRIIDANPQIDDPNAIPQGMKLRIPNG
ncbi:MAG: LysM peptidoglycan-binding domain-containing protein [Planctomycetes bacterium]|jgi:nucleoid-associated protein YgaU|nr:LysM peptidoglycan-binding domain-containing protein [Phycisphaerae bacterium]NBB94337.1 LysM peptidoglycan-binding domain-containing protein [Planctomycetota bacterium]